MNADERFYRDHEPRLFAYLKRLTGDYYAAGDLLQESFTRYLERYQNRPKSPSLLYAIARNAFIDKVRRSKKEAPPLENSEGDHRDNPERRVLVQEEWRQVMAAMEQLSSDERDILSLAASGDLSYQEIAGVLGISKANVKVRVHRARIHLRKILKKGEIDG